MHDHAAAAAAALARSGVCIAAVLVDTQINGCEEAR